MKNAFFFFFQHQEFSFLLKERVCPLVIKLFSPNIKFRQGSSTSSSPAPVEKPYFPICMRLLRVVSVLIKQFYSLLVRLCSNFLYAILFFSIYASTVVNNSINYLLGSVDLYWGKKGLNIVFLLCVFVFTCILHILFY